MKTESGRVLVVDDNRDIREAFEELLGDEGYDVVSAANGREAMAHLQSGAALPRLIFLDLMMPVMDGYAFLIEQKRDPVLSDIPVVVMSAVDPAHALQGVKVLRKPVGADQVLGAAERFCSVRE